MHRAAVVILMGICMAAAGCGGGGGSKSSTTQSPAQFRSQAAQLCTSAQTKLSSIPQPNSAKELPAYLDKVEQVASPYVDKLDALNPPSQLAGPFNQIIAINRQELTVVGKAKSLLKNGGSATEAARLIQQSLDKLSATENAKWRQLGVPKCAS